MAKHKSDSSLEEIKLKIKEIPISHIVRNYIKLQPQGENFIGLCPFHADSHPSLHVNDRKGMFRCFACSTGGDAITFVEKFTSLPFLDAIKEIARIVGLAFDDLFGKKKIDPKSELALSLLQSSSTLYRNFAKSGKYPAFSEFQKRRKLTSVTTEKFELGFAPNANTFLDSLQGNTKAIVIAKEIGLIREGLKDRNAHNQAYDTFRDRIVFPIKDIYGTVVGFSSRATKEYQKAKYMNSNESFIFNKRNILYGLNFAKRSIRECDSVILVEGHMDLITLHQYGFENSVALMGVALSERTIGTLKYLTNNFILGLDSDPAGRLAMERLNSTLLQHKIIPKFIEFYPFKDPDEFLNQGQGLNAAILLQQKIKDAKSLMDDMIEKMIPKVLPSIPEQKIALLEKVMRLLAPLGNEIAATERIINASRSIGIQAPPMQILEIYQKKYLPTTSSADTAHAYVGKSQSTALPVSTPASVQIPILANKLSKAERSLLQEIILHPECLQHEQLPEILEYVENNEVNRLIRWLKKIQDEILESEYVTTIINYLSKENFCLEIRELIGNLLFQFKQNSDTSQEKALEEKIVHKLVIDLKVRLKKESLSRKRKALLEQQKSCQQQEDALPIISELMRIDKELGLIKKI
ncbi:MAG: DNA primase [Oligoflexia bacterium]|nr:DNA primase [Oligoflexia bacterium]